MPAAECTCSVLDVLSLGLDSAIEPEFKRLQPGELAWDSANSNGKLLVVKEGLLRVYHGDTPTRRRLAGLVGPRHWLGAEVLAGIPGAAKAYAASPALVALVDAARVIDAASTNPSATAALVTHLSKQFCIVQQEVTESRFLDCTSQVVRALLRLGMCGAQVRDGERVTLTITQQDVADTVGIARETVNAILQRLAELNLIQKQRGRITLNGPALQEYATHVDQDASAT